MLLAKNIYDSDSDSDTYIAYSLQIKRQMHQVQEFQAYYLAR